MATKKTTKTTTKGTTKGKPAEQTKPAAEKLNREECANRVVRDWLSSHNNGDISLEELAERADKMFQAGHPDAEPNEELASWGIQVVMEQLEAVDLVVIERHESYHPNVRPNGKKNGNGNGK